MTQIRAELLRNNELHCVNALRIEERETVNKVHRRRHEKYAVQRLATNIGIFGRSAQPNLVALRLDLRS